MGKQWETTWIPHSNSTTRWICRSLAFHNCWWSKMDVGGIPLDRKSKKCQGSHGEWIVLNLSGNIIFPFQTKYVFSCWSNAVEWLKWVFTWLKLILALSALVSSFSGIERTGWTFSCSSLKVVYFSAVAGTRYIKTHMQLLTVLELTRMKTINMYRKAGHHPRVSSLASLKMWHLPLFIVHMLHPQFRLWSLIPTQRLPSLSSLPPTNPSSHINQ